MTQPQPQRPDAARSRYRTVVVWGCAIHLTKAGEACQHCADQAELFPRSEVPHRRRRRR